MIRWRQFKSLPKEPDLTLFRIISPTLLLLASLTLLPMAAWSQATISPDTAVTVEMLESRIQEIGASKDPEGESLLEFYHKAISLIEQQRTYEVATQEFIKARELVPQQSAELRKQLAKLETRAPRELPDSLSGSALPELEQQLLSDKADMSGLTGTLARLEASLEKQAQRPQQARNQLSEGRKNQAHVQESLKSLTAEGQSQRLVEARRWSLEYELRALNAEIEMLNQELLSQPMRVELLGAQRDTATLELSRKLNFVALLETLVTEKRLSEAVSAKEAADETERQSFGKHALVQEIARKNTELGDELNSLATALENITTEENEAAVKAKRVSANFR